MYFYHTHKNVLGMSFRVLINNDRDDFSFICKNFLFHSSYSKHSGHFKIFLAKFFSVLGPLHQLSPLAGIYLSLIFKCLDSSSHFRTQLQYNLTESFFDY